MGELSLKEKMCWCCGKGCDLVFAVLFVCVWIVQGTMYYYAMLGCGPRALRDYNYPGAEASDTHEADWNLQPRITLITEREGTRSSKAWDSIPSNDASTVTDAPNGVWWSTWGPIFNTYTFEDVANSKVTVYMRRNLLRLGMSHRIGRCDGQGPFVTFTEGSNFFINRIRLIFGMNQGMTFKIYLDDELVAVAEETQHGVKSLTFREMGTDENCASAVLQTRHFHGQFDQWLVKSKASSPLPYFVPDATAVLFANHVTKDEPANKVKAVKGDDDHPVFLEAAPAALALMETPEANLTAGDVAKAQALRQALAMHEAVMPPHWRHEHDVSAPLLALAAVFLVPLLGVPCMIKCKNGNLNKVF